MRLSSPFPSGSPRRWPIAPGGRARSPSTCSAPCPTSAAKFPRALSEGPGGAFCRWLCTAAAAHHGLACRRRHIAEAFRLKPASRIRQAYELSTDLRRSFPLALTPAGRKPFLIWLVAHGKLEYGLRDEQIWWFLQECDEDPGRELAHTYLITPEWQRRVRGRTDGLRTEPVSAVAPAALLTSTTPGRRRSVGPLPWARCRSCLWLMRVGEHWHITEPRALVNPQKTRRLVEWLRRDGHLGQAIESPWWQQLETSLALQSARPLGMNILGHFFYPSGLQVSVRSVVEALTRAGVPTSCRDVPTTVESDVPGRSETLGLELFDTTLIHVQPEPFFDTCYLRAGLEPRERCLSHCHVVLGVRNGPAGMGQAPPPDPGMSGTDALHRSGP